METWASIAVALVIVTFFLTVWYLTYRRQIKERESETVELESKTNVNVIEVATDVIATTLPLAPTMEMTTLIVEVSTPATELELTKPSIEASISERHRLLEILRTKGMAGEPIVCKNCSNVYSDRWDQCPQCGERRE